MAIEEMFLLDLLMDMGILAAIQFSMDRPCPKRILRATLVLQGATALCISASFLHAAVPLFFPIAAFALLGRRRLKTILEAALALFCAYAACAGFMVVSGKRIPAVLGCMLLLCLLLRRRRHIRNQWNIEIILEKNLCKCCFTALIDTGNRLKEHRSALPILIAEERVIRKAVETISPDEYIPVPYGALGGCGEILCFRADALYIRCGNGRILSAPECLIGIYPSVIPGSTHALAPPEFAQCPAGRLFPNIPHINISRRYFNGVFKHKAIHLWAGGTDSQGLGMLHRRQ